ncbi:MAG: hypothetical protein IJX13_07370 [Clostridia bacterium]|nr:hypothetical protein [Clostridia bacterium]
MKKLIALMLATVCTFALVGCIRIHVNDSAKTDTSHTDDTHQPGVLESYDTFTEYLDAIHFVPGLSQSDFRSQIEKYRFNGSAVTDIVAGMHYDGPMGGGWQATGELFGFYNDYTVEENNKFANYSNSLCTTVPLDGLELPFEINFEDTLATALQKLEVDLDLQGGLVWDEDSAEALTLYGDEHSSLQLLNCKSEGSTSARYDYALKYTETYPSIRNDGRTADVTRYVSMLFSTVNDKIDLIEISVNERYQVNYPTETKFKIEFADDYEIVNEVKEAYFEGEEVVIQLPTITEHYYVLYVNGVKQEPDETVSNDWTYIYYTFTMPNEDVLIKIEDISVDIPFPPQQ